MLAIITFDTRPLIVVYAFSGLLMVMAVAQDIYGLAGRQAQGFLSSLFKAMKLSLKA